MRRCARISSRRLKVLWFAGAGLAQHVFDEWKEMAHRTCGEDILFLTGLGSTETAPYAFGRMWDTANAANIGLPPPGLDVKLVPLDGKYEARLKGPNITPGYWREPKLTAEAFDEEGFYRLGDALKFDDPAIAREGPAVRGPHRRGLQARDRHLGRRRAVARAIIAHFAPYVRDVVIAGADRDFIAVLIFPDLDACRRLAPDLKDASPADDRRARERAARIRLPAEQSSPGRRPARPTASCARSCSIRRPRSMSAR